METILYYVLPNVALFGGLYVIGAGFEALSWKFIVWYTDNV